MIIAPLMGLPAAHMRPASATAAGLRVADGPGVPLRMNPLPGGSGLYSEPRIKGP